MATLFGGVTITRTGYDPSLGRDVKDPTLETPSPDVVYTVEAWDSIEGGRWTLLFASTRFDLAWTHLQAAALHSEQVEIERFEDGEVTAHARMEWQSKYKYNAESRRRHGSLVPLSWGNR